MSGDLGPDSRQLAGGAACSYGESPYPFELAVEDQRDTIAGEMRGSGRASPASRTIQRVRVEAGRPPSVLFLTSNTEDYLSDSLFHGLRTILGERVVDFPKNEISYRTYPHPHGLEPGRNCLVYHDADDLFRKVDAITDDEYERLQAGALEWARANSTRCRAEGFVETIGIACGQ
jgi:hypothetical protein